MPILVLFFLAAVFTNAAEKKPPGRFAYYLGIMESTEDEDSLAFFLSLEGKWKTEAITDKGKTIFTSGKVLQPFDMENTARMLEKIESDLRSNKIPDGSQLLLAINSHGGPGGEIFTIDGTYDLLTHLLLIKKLAVNKNIRLGVLAGSCYSGEFLNLQDDKTCVLSISPLDQAGFATPAHALFSALPSSQDLEQLHLKSRAIDEIKKFGIPLISTEAGEQSFEVLKGIKPLLTLPQNSVEIFNYVSACHVGFTNPPLKRFLELIAKRRSKILLASFPQVSKRALELENKRNRLLSDFSQHEAMDLYEQKCPETGISEPNTIECYRFPEEITNELTNVLANLDEIKNKLQKKNIPSDSLNKLKEKRLNLERAIEHIKKITESRDFKRKQMLINKKPREFETELINFSREVHEFERSVYHLLYSEFSKQSTKPNPCKDFKL